MSPRARLEIKLIKQNNFESLVQKRWVELTILKPYSYFSRGCGAYVNGALGKTLQPYEIQFIIFFLTLTASALPPYPTSI